MPVNQNISSFLVSVLFKTKTIEIQRWFTPKLMNGRNCNAQYGGIVPPSKRKSQISHRNLNRPANAHALCKHVMYELPAGIANMAAE